MTEVDYVPEKKPWRERVLAWAIAAPFWAFGIWGIFDAYETLNAAPRWVWDIAVIIVVGLWMVWQLCDSRFKQIEGRLGAIEWRVRAIHERQRADHSRL